MSFDDPQQNDPGAFSQDVKFSPTTARVPDKIGAGVCATGVVVLNGPHEFMVDFVQRLVSPQQLVARVVISPTLMPAFIKALSENIAHYTARFGPPPALPVPPPGTPVPPIEEVYGQLKISDEAMAGIYCNTVMVAHAPAEFCFDFITAGFPRSVVSARVMMAAPHAPKVLDSLRRSWDQYQRRMNSSQEP
jgi:Protein of unknown function (DUF3467)